MRTEWWSRRAIGLHAAVLITVPGCIFACWWQTTRAISGNTLSWVYTFEWPFFAGYAIYMWWKLVHEDPVRANREMLAAVAAGAAAAAPAPAPTRAAATVGAEPEADADSEDAIDAGTEPHPHRPDFDPYDDDADPELAAYNRYLAELHATGRPKRW